MMYTKFAIVLCLCGCSAISSERVYSRSPVGSGAINEPPNLAIVDQMASSLGACLALDSLQISSLLGEMDKFAKWEGATAAEPWLRARAIAIAQVAAGTAADRRIFLTSTCEAISSTPGGKQWLLAQIRGNACPGELRKSGVLALADSPGFAAPGELASIAMAAGGEDWYLYCQSASRVDAGARLWLGEVDDVGRARLLMRFATQWLFSPSVAYCGVHEDGLDLTVNPEVRWLRAMAREVGTAAIVAAVGEIHCPAYMSTNPADFPAEDFDYRENVIGALCTSEVFSSWHWEAGPRPVASWA